jgi:hypothetical protein
VSLASSGSISRIRGSRNKKGLRKPIRRLAKTSILKQNTWWRLALPLHPYVSARCGQQFKPNAFHRPVRGGGAARALNSDDRTIRSVAAGQIAAENNALECRPMAGFRTAGG